MKQIYLSVLIFLFISIGASAQTIIYHENFSDEVTGAWTLQTGAWVLTTEATAVANTQPQASKGRYARTSATVAGEKTFLLSDNISTVNYSSATITWQQYRNPYKTNGNKVTELTAPVNVSYSIDGGATMVLFYTTTNAVNNAWNRINGGNPITLPQAALGHTDVSIYISINYTNTVNGNNADNAFYAIDDITIRGELIDGYSVFNWADRPLNEDPFVVSGAESSTPYTIDGVTMRWSVARAAGVTFEMAKVDNQSYKAGTNSFSIIQKGATPATGSTIQLDLNKAVDDLSFTLFDVDVAANQFIDRVIVKGYNNGVLVPLLKSKVRTTSYNQFTAPETITGLLANDNTSGEGDVIVTFASAVTKVVIEYRNDSQTRNAEGRQGLGIHNLSWRNDMIIAPLPVELMSFKGMVQNYTSKLAWSTASERNNSHFEVQRSQDGKTFETIGSVTGTGYSNTKLNYNFTDQAPAMGINYYRLRQVDFDGKTAYSSVISVKVTADKSAKGLAQVYPTMASEQITIALLPTTANTRISILDASGKTIKQFAQVTTRQLEVPVQQLNSGIYFVVVDNGETRETYRFLKQ